MSSNSNIHVFFIGFRKQDGKLYYLVQANAVHSFPEQVINADVHPIEAAMELADPLVGIDFVASLWRLAPVTVGDQTYIAFALNCTDHKESLSLPKTFLWQEAGAFSPPDLARPFVERIESLDF